MMLRCGGARFLDWEVGGEMMEEEECNEQDEFSVESLDFTFIAVWK